MTPREMVARLRSLLNESVAGFWTDSELISYLNLGQDHAAQIIQDADASYFVDRFRISWVAGQELYAVPIYARDRRIVNCERIDQEQPMQIVPTRREDRFRTGPGLIGSAAPFDRYWYPFGNQIGFYPVPTESIADVAEFTFVRRLPPMQYGTFLVPGAASATLRDSGDAALVGETSREDEHYKGARIMLTAGTGAGQIRTITSYAGTTKVVTFDAPFVPAPTAATTYEILTDIPVDQHEALVKYAAIQAVEKDENPTLIQQWLSDTAAVLQRLVHSVQERQVQEPEYVRDTFIDGYA